MAKKQSRRKGKQSAGRTASGASSAPSMPPETFKKRVRALQDRLSDARAQALLITHRRDILYLTGFAGDDSWALVPLNRRKRKLYILSDFRFEQQIAREAPHATAVIRKQGMVEALAKLLHATKVEKIALQPAHVTLALRKKLVKQMSAGRLVEVDDGLADQRAVKDEDEVKRIRKALGIQQQAYRETLAQLAAGQSEQQIAAYLEYRMRSLGADRPSFPSIVAADAHAALPHAVPGTKKLRQGGVLLIDWGARSEGYCSDLTRVVALGGMKRRMRDVYRIVLDAQEAAIAAIAPGKKLREVDAAARDLIDKAGYGERFGHSLGHGIGLDVHEQPTLSPRAPADAELVPGHVVTVEPGIYLPGIGGVRLEDDVLVTPRGAQVLSDLPKSVESAII